MRTVAKAVIRSLSASVAVNVANLETHLRTDIIQQVRRKEVMLGDSLSFSASSCRDMGRSFEMKLKAESLSPIYKLTPYEQSCFEELQDKECDYYPNNSTRGDVHILNMTAKNIISEHNVNSANIMFSLKSIRFVNSIVFGQNCDIFLTTANYIQRLLHTKAVKKDLMQFITAAMYDLALEKRVGKALSKDEVSLLLSLTNIPINHIEDFSRMKALLLKQLNQDLESISIVDYLQILLKFNLHTDLDNLPESHNQLIDIVSLIASSCELSHFTLACQAISVISVAARHVSFDTSFYQQFAHIIERFPMIFTSPVRLTQFAKLDNVSEDTLKQCTEMIVRYVAKYYEDCETLRVVATADNDRGRLSRKRDNCGDGGCGLETVIEEEIEEEEEEEEGNDGREEQVSLLQTKNEKKIDVSELMDKLRLVRLSLNTPINGKQKQRHKRIKKRLSRQLKKYDHGKQLRSCFRPLLVGEEA